MKEFNLEAALNGAEVITRDGRSVTQITRFDCNERYPIHALVGEHIVSFKLCGAVRVDIKSDLDLFMKTVKETGWVFKTDIVSERQMERMVKVEWEE